VGSPGLPAWCNARADVQNGISLAALNDAYFLDEREIRILARHPLASIGGHTTSYAALASLDRPSARAELADNRHYLESYFSCPFGTLHIRMAPSGRVVLVNSKWRTKWVIKLR
jgi:hypothetical protein